MSDRVHIDVAAHVAHVRLTRADKMNALDGAMFRAIAAAGERLRNDPDIRAVVLSGDGRAFCTGIDLASVAEEAGRARTLADIGSRTHAGMNIAQYIVMQWRQLPMPVIAAVHDMAFGGGFQLALGADMRFIAPTARLSIMEIQWGLVPDMGGSYLLRRLVRPDVAFELTMSGRVFAGQEAERLGLATRLCAQPVSEALAFATEIAGRSPDAIRAGKRLLTLDDEAWSQRVLAAEAAEQQVLLGSRHHAEAVRAGLAGETPHFSTAEPPAGDI